MKHTHIHARKGTRAYQSNKGSKVHLGEAVSLFWGYRQSSYIPGLSAQLAGSSASPKALLCSLPLTVDSVTGELLPFSQGRSPPGPHKFPLCQPVTFYLLNPPPSQRNTSIWKKLSTASLGSGKGPLSKEQVKSNREHQCLVASAHAPVDTREDVHMVLS